MENLEKRPRLDCEVTVDFRDKLVCKKCDIFPRPGTEIMRCASCKKILCGNCCGTKCPLCQHESKNPKCSTFIKEFELMDVLSGLKTHPCINVKNGCHEEILAKLDRLTAHDRSCVFQKVPCPDCEELVIFKDLGQKHLKQAHVSDGISVYHDTETNEYTYKPKIFGIYKLQATLINGRKYYKKDKFAISWDGAKFWNISYDKSKGTPQGFAFLENDVQNLHKTTDWMLGYGFDSCKVAGEMLRIKGT